MKRSPARLRSSKLSSFTLVELLVVIGIIAILAGVLLSAGGAAIRAAMRAKAANTATQIQTAVLNYYTEYSVYPMVAAATPVDTLFQTAADWQPVTVVLCGGIDPGNPGGGQYSASSPYNLNTRQIPYLTLNRADLDTTVTPAVPKTPFLSPTGTTQYFYMAIDDDYSGVIGDSGTSTKPPDFSSMSSTLTTYNPFATTKAVAGGVVVWANGDPQSTATKTHPNFWVHTY